MIRFQSWAATHPGAVRSHNEDSFVDRPDLGLWAVADGAGGHEAGEIASGMLKDALEAVPTGLSAAELLAQVRLRVERVHQALRDEAQRRGPRAIIASTLVVLLARDGHFACLWAGDSRIYLLRNGELAQVTRDHSLVRNSSTPAPSPPRKPRATRAPTSSPAPSAPPSNWNWTRSATGWCPATASCCAATASTRPWRMPSSRLPGQPRSPGGTPGRRGARPQRHRQHHRHRRRGPGRRTLTAG